MDHPILSSDDLAHFAAQGFVRVTNALPMPFVAQVQTAIWDQLQAQYGMARHDPSSWRPEWCGINKKLIDTAVGVELTPRLVTAVDQLLGAAQWRPVKTLGGLLLTMPEPEQTPWELPHQNGWHFDHDPRTCLERVDELMLFTFFSPVRPRGGGTLVLAGSPRLVARFLVANATDNGMDTPFKLGGLAAWHPWLEELMGSRPSDARATSTLMDEPVEVHGVQIQIVELTGEPGDAVLCHPALLHTVSMNCSTVPRLMRRTNVRRKR